MVMVQATPLCSMCSLDASNMCSEKRDTDKSSVTLQSYTGIVNRHDTTILSILLLEINIFRGRRALSKRFKISKFGIFKAANAAAIYRQASLQNSLLSWGS